MKNYTIRQAKDQLSKLIKRALQGEEIIISNRHKPVVRLTAIQSASKKLGFLGKKVWIRSDSDAPLKDFQKYQ